MAEPRFRRVGEAIYDTQVGLMLRVDEAVIVLNGAWEEIKRLRLTESGGISVEDAAAGAGAAGVSVVKKRRSK